MKLGVQAIDLLAAHNGQDVGRRSCNRQRSSSWPWSCCDVNGAGRRLHNSDPVVLLPSEPARASEQQPRDTTPTACLQASDRAQVMELDAAKYLLLVGEHGVDEVILATPERCACFLVQLLGDGALAFGAVKNDAKAKA